MKFFLSALACVLAVLGAAGCVTVDDGRRVGADGSREVSVILNYPKATTQEGALREIEAHADARMTATCTAAGQDAPVVMHRVWMAINFLMVTYRCGAA
jgi:hypothetical protein